MWSKYTVLRNFWKKIMNKTENAFFLDCTFNIHKIGKKYRYAVNNTSFMLDIFFYDEY